MIVKPGRFMKNYDTWVMARTLRAREKTVRYGAVAVSILKRLRLHQNLRTDTMIRYTTSGQDP
jgi:hypothetical protein